MEIMNELRVLLGCQETKNEGVKLAMEHNVMIIFPYSDKLIKINGIHSEEVNCKVTQKLSVSFFGNEYYITRKENSSTIFFIELVNEDELYVKVSLNENIEEIDYFEVDYDNETSPSLGLLIRIRRD